MTVSRWTAAVLAGVLLALSSSAAQAEPGRGALTLEVVPDRLTLAVGERATLAATVRDGNGAVVDDATVVYFSRARRSVGVTRGGEVEAYRPGAFTLVALVPAGPGRPGRRSAGRARVEVPVTVPPPAAARVRFVDVPPRYYAGTRPRLSAEVVDAAGAVRTDVPVSFASADAGVAEVDGFGFLTLHAPGAVEIAAAAEDVAARLTIEVEPNPVASLDLRVESPRRGPARTPGGPAGRRAEPAAAAGPRGDDRRAGVRTALTGDVVRFTATARDARGREVPGVPVQFAVGGETAPAIVAAGAPAHVAEDGRFVAERSGLHTVVAAAGSRSASVTIAVGPRDVGRDVEVVGRGKVLDRHTSDLWIWEGTDGRDYAITGTWGSDGSSYIWDVTDPARIEKLREVNVDARTVNDVKVSEAGDVAVISREGASDRRNGIVVLGVGNPREGVPILSEFTDQLTGGVHNLFIAGNHVFALSAGRRYDVIDIEDPRRPRRVGRFELDTPGHGIHDVWVSGGVAFSSNWTDGVVAVDVGGGGRGGTPERPVELGRYAYPSGWNHAAFPYRSRSTGKFYVFAGDEAFPWGGYSAGPGGPPSRAAGWIHVIDWSDWDDPREVARYQVPEAGSHNLWVEDDVLYVGYYNGGLRVVDVSGELMGDLYRQGREIARYVPADPEGYIANAPFVWGPQPYKGHVFFTDWNTGLWAVKLRERTGPAPVVGEPR